MKSTTNQEAGEAFLDELRRHHFGCERPEPVNCLLEAVEVDRPANLTGDAFVAELLWRFSNDRLYVELT